MINIIIDTYLLGEIIIKVRIVHCLLLVFLFLIFNNCTQIKTLNNDVSISNGHVSIDESIKTTNFEIRLNGNWEFYPEEFIITNFEKYMHKKKYLKIPGNWASFKDMKIYSYGTYRLVIDNNLKSGIYSIKTDSPISSARFYINKINIGDIGIIGKSPATSNPSAKLFNKSFYHEGGPIEILIHMSNYKNPIGGGFMKPVYFGTQNAVYRHREIQQALDLFLIGSLIIAGLYNIIIFFHRKKSKSALYFGLYALVIAFRVGITSEQFLVSFLDNYSWEYFYKLEFSTILLSIPLLSLYIIKLFPEEFEKPLFYIYVFINPLWMIIGALIPAPHFFTFFFYSYYIQYFFGGAGIIMLIISVLKHRDSSLVFLFSFLVLFTTAVNDMLFSKGILQTGLLLQWGLFLFTFSQIIILARKYSVALVREEKATIHLAEMQKKLHKVNTYLEKEITHRNRQLMEQIEEKNVMEDELFKRRKLDALGLLAGGIAHDFNNLLTIIQGNLSLTLHLTEKDNDLNNSLQDAYAATLRAKELSNQLLTFSKGGKPIIKVCDLKKILISTAEFTLRGTSTTYELKIDEDIKNSEVDEGQISQVLSNIFINARQAMDNAGHIIIEMQTVEFTEKEFELKPGFYNKISITDNGPGISDDIIDKIFDPFFTTKSKGKGLGLATCYSIIKKHSGSVIVDSNSRSIEKSGTTFTIYLPSTDKEIIEEQTENQAIKKHKGRVLFLDDETEICKLSAKILSQLGFETATVNTPDEAVDEFKKASDNDQSFACVIMDLIIPGAEDRAVTLKRLKTIDPEIKTIITSGDVANKIFNNPKNYGFDAALKKPFTIMSLNEAINKII